MKKNMLGMVVILFLVLRGLQVQAQENISEEMSGTTIFSADGVVKLELSEDWLLFNTESEYDDEFYDEWQLDKEGVKEVLVNSGGGILAIHKYEDYNIEIIRTKEEIFDFRGVSDEQFEIFLNEMKAAGKEENNGVTVGYKDTYENDVTRYVILEMHYDDESQGIMYQTALGDEVVCICINGVESQTEQNKWVDNVSYEKPVQRYQSSDEQFGRASGRNFIKICIVVIIVVAIIQHRKEKKEK